MEYKFKLLIQFSRIELFFYLTSVTSYFEIVKFKKKKSVFCFFFAFIDSSPIVCRLCFSKVVEY